MRLLRLLAAPVLTGAALAGPPSALAAPCPGAVSCPYVTAQVVGAPPAGVLRFPEAVALDGQGHVYVGDQLGNVVQRFSTSGQFQGLVGSPGDGPGQLGSVGGLATDDAGDVYVVDSTHARVEKFAPDGSFLLAWGAPGTAVGRFRFGASSDPSIPPGGGIAVSGAYVYVADTLNDRIQRFGLDGSDPLIIGTSGAGPGQLRAPRGLAADHGQLLVANDDDQRIDRFDLSGAYLASSGDLGPAGPLHHPYGVALDAVGNAYVADDENHRVVKLSPTLGFLAAWGSRGSAAGQFIYPRALASDGAGNVFVADTANDRVQALAPDGSFRAAWGISARGPGVLSAPHGLATDATGRLLVTDPPNKRLAVFAPGGTWLTGWAAGGGAAPGFLGPLGVAAGPGTVWVADTGNHRLVRLDGLGLFLSDLPGPRAGLTLDGPAGIAVNAQGDAWVADTGHDRVVELAPDGTVLASIGAGTASSGDGRQPRQFVRPTAVALDAAGNLYVADADNGRVQKFDARGAFLTQWSGDGRLRDPEGIAVDGAGRVFVADAATARVEIFDSWGRALGGWGEPGSSPGQFLHPSGLAVDCHGALYVADTANNRVQRFALIGAVTSACAAPRRQTVRRRARPLLRVVDVSARTPNLLRLTLRCEAACRVRVRVSAGPSAGGPRLLLSTTARLRARRNVTLALRVSPGAVGNHRGDGHRPRTAQVLVLARARHGRFARALQTVTLPPGWPARAGRPDRSQAPPPRRR